MKHQAKFTGRVIEVKNASFLTIKTTENEEIPCYVVKKVAAKNWTPNEGVEAVFRGGFKTFQDGTNYFVIHQIENFKLGSYKTQTYVDPNENLPYLQRVLKAIKNAPCRNYMFDRVKAELIDGSTGDKVEFNLATSNSHELEFWGSNCAVYEHQRRNVFYCPGIFKEFNGANLANKKWGSKVEGKLRVEILEIREKIGSCGNWVYTSLEDVESFRGDHFKNIKTTLHSRRDRFRSEHVWNPMGGGYATFEVSKIRITIER